MRRITIVSADPIRFNFPWVGASGLVLPSQTLTRRLVREVTVLHVVFDERVVIAH